VLVLVPGGSLLCERGAVGAEGVSVLHSRKAHRRGPAAGDQVRRRSEVPPATGGTAVRIRRCSSPPPAISLVLVLGQPAR